MVARLSDLPVDTMTVYNVGRMMPAYVGSNQDSPQAYLQGQIHRTWQKNKKQARLTWNL